MTAAAVTAAAPARARTPSPRLHLVTDDVVLHSARFVPTAGRLLERFGPRLALHVRGRATPAAVQFRLFTALQEVAAVTATMLLVNERVDVALAADAKAVQLSARALPIAATRRLLPDAWLGYSVHGEAEAHAAAAEGTDCLLVGTIYASASHPGVDGGGPARVAAAAGAGVPVIAIGGITPARVAAVAEAGAHGVAVLGGVWHAPDPTAAVQAYLMAIETAYGEAR